MLDPTLAAAIRHAVHGHVLQVEPVAELMSGAYDAVTTVGDFFQGSLLGLGVTEACDGEIVSIAGETWRIPADGVPHLAPDDLGLAFAVRASQGEPISMDIQSAVAWSDLDALIGDYGADSTVLAIRIDGRFSDVLLRSEARQSPPYRPLSEVLAHEVQFPFAEWQGTMVGFRFPRAEGPVPGFHLHALSEDRTSGGHCHHATVLTGSVRLWSDDVTIGLEHQQG